MMANILPLVFLLVGTGGGIGAGLYLAPASQSGMTTEEQDGNTSRAVSDGSSSTMPDGSGGEADPASSEFVEMSNQFIIPVVRDDMVAALVVVTLSLETRPGISEEIYGREPKLRDAFLRVLFDHANMGGFQGAFTRADKMDLLRTALREVARKEIGPDLLDVLIVDIIRQDT